MMFDITQALFWFRPLFVVQLLVAEFLFARNMDKRQHFAVRILLSIVLALVIAVVLPFKEGIAYSTTSSVVTFLLLFLLSVGVIAISYKSPVNDVLFCAMAGYTVQHVAQELYEIMNVALGFNGKNFSDFYASDASLLSSTQLFQWMVYFWVFAMVYYVAHAVLSSRMDNSMYCIIKKVQIIAVMTLIILVNIVFSSIVTFSLSVESNKLSVLLMHCYNVFFCVFMLFLLFELPKRIKAEQDYVILKQLRHQEKEQFAFSKENINLINIKCHDLKQHVRRITDNNINEGAMEEIENILSTYDSLYHTDNEALDVILTEKSITCQKKNIRLSCIAQGNELAFMKETDIYSLFGNVLDNAIEAVEKLSEQDRYINLSIRRKNHFVIISARNCYNGQIKLNNGMPSTIKDNTNYHGFGIKSIEYITNKYGGELNIDVDDAVFNINIVFPLN